MSDVLLVARNKLKALEGEVDELRQFIKRYEALEREAGAQSMFDRNTNLRVLPDMDFPTTRKMTMKEAIEEASSKLLSNRFMTIENLLKELDAIGIRVGGEKRHLNLSSMLSRSEKFIYNRAAGGWGLKKNTPSLEFFR